MRTYVSFTEARALILEHVPLLPEENIPWQEALNRILREPIISKDAIPRFDNSAMDGFAIRLRDVQTLPTTLRITTPVAAGMVPPSHIPEGTAIPIMTGAPIPPDTEAIVPVEWTEPVDTHSIRILKRPKEGAHIRRKGEDVSAGEVLISPGVRITPPVIGLMATFGYASILVSQRPRVSILTTGSELVPPEETPGEAQLRDSNGPTLRAQALLAGAEIQALLHAGDEKEAIRKQLERALPTDVLVLSGGVSMGTYDLVREELARRGVKWLFWKVRQRPGKPLVFGLLGQIPVFGLPGNPVSASVCFEMYVRPALAHMMGQHPPLSPPVTARLTAPFDKKVELHYFTRGKAHVNEQGNIEVTPLRRQGSHMFYGMAEANSIIHFPEGQAHFEKGALVSMEWLNWSY